MEAVCSHAPWAEVCVRVGFGLRMSRHGQWRHLGNSFLLSRCGLGPRSFECRVPIGSRCLAARSISSRRSWGLGAGDQGFVVYTAEVLFPSLSLPCHSGRDAQRLLQLVNLTCHQTPEVETCAAHSARVLCFTRGSP